LRQLQLSQNSASHHPAQLTSGAGHPCSPEINIEIPLPIIRVFQGKADFRGIYGGRGGGKTFSVAKILAYMADAKPIRVLCAREIQRTIAQSVFSS